MSLFIKYMMILIISVVSNTVAYSSVVAGDSDGYQIGPGDILNVSVWKEENLNEQLLVKPDGAITFPLAGEVQAGGMTTVELTATLTEKLKRFIPNPVVTVTVAKTDSHKIYIVGKVARPGQYVATDYMDVLQAISLAGGVTAFADTDDIKIIRKTGSEKKVFLFDYDDAIDGENLEANIELKAGDTVVVP